MQWWEPDPTEPELWDWWAPLLLVARRARADRCPWPVHADEFVLSGRADRPPRPAVWVYVHHSWCGSIRADASGRTYVLRAGRHVEVGVRRAIWAARLPDVVEPVWFDAPRERPDPVPDAAPPPHRGCHLRLVSAGERPQAGHHPRQRGREGVDVLVGGRPPDGHPEGS